MAKVLMKGNEAVARAAIEAGCNFFAGYPITPQNEIPEYMSREMPIAGGTFVQAESEISAINMIYGASGAGARAMTSSSSPGIALKQEGITYMAGAELPAVIVNMMRGGPGLGGIQPAQSDYYMSTRGGGNGDYRHVVYAPSSIQEAVDYVQEAFDVADYYRMPVMVLADGMIGQMMEAVEFNKKEATRQLEPKTWATTGTKGDREHDIINSLYLEAAELEKHNHKLQAKYDIIEKTEARYENLMVEDAEIVLVAYGTTARIVKNAVLQLREEGIKAGLIRPITLWPYPVEAFKGLVAKNMLCVEMSMGQMVEDVKLAVECKIPVHFTGRVGGMIPEPTQIINVVKEIVGGTK